MWRVGRARGLVRSAGAAMLAVALVTLGWWAGGAGRGPAQVEGRQLPLVFIGGVPRSGTTLMRAMLDAHRDVRCGQETRVILHLLETKDSWMESDKDRKHLEDSGINRELLNNAIAAFCAEIIIRHGDPAPRLCNKDPFLLTMGTYVSELFPKAKFLYMVRDGRATIHSIITKEVSATGFDLESYRESLIAWNRLADMMLQQCYSLSDRCLPVHYESLVLQPRETLRRVLAFLDLPWDEAVLHHEQYINQPNGVALSYVERSSDQIVRPVNSDSLDKWVGHIPSDVRAEMADVAPMLSVLGYNPWANPPRYADLTPIPPLRHHL